MFLDMLKKVLVHRLVLQDVAPIFLPNEKAIAVCESFVNEARLFVECHSEHSDGYVLEF
jgi:hypothetical protein